MVTRAQRFAAAFGLAALVAGCAPRIAPPLVVPVTMPVTLAPPPPVPPRTEEIAAIVTALDRGEVAAARSRIAGLLARDPHDADVLALHAAVDGDPVALLGTESFAYAVRPGDTMAGLARRFLGNRLRFFLLARYNGIAAPGTLTAGTVLRIPGRAPARPKPRAVAASAPRRTDPATARRLRGDAMQLLRAGRGADALVLLRRAAIADPADPIVRRDLERLAAQVH